MSWRRPFRRVDVVPREPVEYSPYVCLANASAIGNLALLQALGGEPMNVAYEARGELRVADGLPAQRTWTRAPLARAVAQVVGLGTEKQVACSNARGVVALVKYVEPKREFPVLEEPRCARRE